MNNSLRACEISEDVTLDVSPFMGVVLTIPVLLLDPEYQQLAFDALRAEPGRVDVEARAALSELLTHAIIGAFAKAGRPVGADE